MEKILFLSLCLVLRRNSTTDSKMDLKMSSSDIISPDV